MKQVSPQFELLQRPSQVRFCNNHPRFPCKIGHFPQLRTAASSTTMKAKKPTFKTGTGCRLSNLWLTSR
jgi:hypothetical protein